MMHWGYAYYLSVADLAKAGTDSFGVYYTINWTSSESYLTCCFNNGSSTWDGTDRRVNKPSTFPAEVWIKTSSATVYTSNPNDTTPPTVSLTAPAAGATCTGNVTVSATASDNNSVAKVEFYCDTNLIGTDTSSPYSITWNSAYTLNGTHSITAKATDAAGNTTTSAARSVTTSNPNIAPVANAGSDVTALVNSAVTLSGSGSYDPNGTIASYRWTYGSTTKTGVNPSFTFTATGTYTITLTVTDNEGATSTDTVIVTVVNQLARTDFRRETIYFVITTRFYDGDTGNNFADPYSPNRRPIPNGEAISKA
jgi:PKD repeat protein